MKKNGLLLFGCLGFLVIGIIVLISVFAALGFRSGVVKLENQIEAQHIANQSNYDTMWKKFKEMTQVTDLQADHFKEVYTDLIAGRYENSDLLFQMVQEQNPNLDTTVYSNLQREISASRTVFDNNQKKVIDIIREYNNKIDTGAGFLWNMIFNFDKIDAKDYIVTSSRTDNAFETGQDDVIDLRGE